jgi:hypothetical protein
MTVVEGSILKVMTWQQVWSFGVVLWELYSRGAQPYMEFTSSQEIVTKVVKEGYRLSPPDNCPEEIANLMQGCWNADPKLRPSFDVSCTCFGLF